MSKCLVTCVSRVARRGISAVSPASPVQQPKHLGRHPYFERILPELSISEFRQAHRNLVAGQIATGPTLSLTGRVMGLREAGKRLVFVDVIQGFERLQVVVNSSRFPETADFEAALQSIARGNLIEVVGRPVRTKAGEIGVAAEEINLLSTCYFNFPDEKTGLYDPELRSRYRHLDLLANPERARLFITRAKVISSIRRFLEERGFMEVETPTLTAAAGGANAKPFVTTLCAYNTEMQLRIAPELYLKQLIIGGFEKVFELGKQFRNEGIDASHNPEFTSCEFYQAFAGTKDLMSMLETLLSELVALVGGSGTFSYGSHRININAPFAEIDITRHLEQEYGLLLPLHLPDDQLSIALHKILNQHGIPHCLPQSPAQLLDRLIGHFIEPKCLQPTFLLGHPLCMSPLAKAHPTRPFIADRFELFVVGKELANGYNELNDPEEQRLRFVQQQQYKSQGDGEAQALDENYLEAMKVGLPPTVGCGIGIDRLVMLLTNSSHIRDVILFPLVRPSAAPHFNKIT